MLLYLVRRILQALAFTLVASLSVYTILVYTMSDSPARTKERILGHHLRQGDYKGEVNDLNELYKLDRPWPLSFFLYLFDPTATTQLDRNFNRVPTGIDISVGGWHLGGSGLLTGRFGNSDPYVHTRGLAVATLLSERWANTAVLIAISLGIALLVGLPLGILQAVHRRSPFDHTATFLSFASLSVPGYVLGIVLAIFLAVFAKLLHDQSGWSWLPYLPPGNTYTPDPPNPWWDRVYHLVLPAATLAVPQVAVLSRYVKFAMLDVLGEDYIRTALATGVPRRRIVLRHALRNALLPIITVLSLIVPSLASSAIVVETVFAYAGMGQLYFQAMGGCLITSALLSISPDTPPCPPLSPIDYPTALVMTMLLIAVTALSSVLADYLYRLADPRISRANSEA